MKIVKTDEKSIFQKKYVEMMRKEYEFILIDVKSYGPAGEIYHTIVYRLYIDKVRHTWNEVQTEIGYSKSRYYEKKEYAVMLFSLMLWRQILAYWSNSTEEMFILEKEVGRDGSLAEERRNL